MPIVRQEPPLRWVGNGTFSRSDFAGDPEGSVYVRPGGKELKKPRVLQAARRPDEGRHVPLLREKARLRRPSPNAARTCPDARSRAPFMVPLATRRAQSSRPRPTSSRVGAKEGRDALCPSWARLRGPSGAKDEFLLAATNKNLRNLAKLIPFHQQSSLQNALNAIRLNPEFKAQIRGHGQSRKTREGRDRRDLQKAPHPRQRLYPRSAKMGPC
jgi:hypothetical protein